MARTKDTTQGARIQALRKKAGWRSQKALAAKLGVASRTVQDWEAGYGLPWDAAVRLARELSTTTEYIYGETEDSSPPATQPGMSTDERLATIEAMIAALGKPDRRSGGDQLRGGYNAVMERINEVRADVQSMGRTLEELVAAVLALQTEREGQRLTDTGEQTAKAPAAKRRPRGRRGGE